MGLRARLSSSTWRALSSAGDVDLFVSSLVQFRMLMLAAACRFIVTVEDLIEAEAVVSQLKQQLPLAPAVKGPSTSALPSGLLVNRDSGSGRLGLGRAASPCTTPRLSRTDSNGSSTRDRGGMGRTNSAGMLTRNSGGKSPRGPPPPGMGRSSGGSAPVRSPLGTDSGASNGGRPV